MSLAEVTVLGLVVALRVGVWRLQGTLDPRAAALLTSLGLVSVLAVALHRCAGRARTVGAGFRSVLAGGGGRSQ